MKRDGRRFKWNEQDIEYLRENYGKIPLDDIGTALGISHTTVRMKAIEIGLNEKKVVKRCEWTPEKLEYLKENYSDCSTGDIAIHVGFAPGTVERKAQMLGLRKSKDYDTRRFYRRYVKDYKNTSM